MTIRLSRFVFAASILFSLLGCDQRHYQGKPLERLVQKASDILKSDADRKADSDAQLAYEKEKKDIEAINRLPDVVMENCTNGIKPHADAPTLQVSSVKDRMPAQGKGLMGTNWPIEETAGGWRLDVIARDSTGPAYLTCYTDTAGRVIRIVATR